jgi:hypothetical protein
LPEARHPVHKKTPRPSRQLRQQQAQTRPVVAQKKLSFPFGRKAQDLNLLAIHLQLKAHLLQGLQKQLRVLRLRVAAHS